MKFSALAMAMNTSSLTRSGMLCSLSHSVQEYLSHSSTYCWPRKIAGTKPMPKAIFSGQVSRSLLLRMAAKPLKGAGMSGKSKRL